MALITNEDDAVALCQEMRGRQDADRVQLDILRLYATGKQALPLVIPRDAPREVREMARISRINLIKIVVEALTQSLFVDNMRTVQMPEAELDEAGEPLPADPEAGDEVSSEVWSAWQANRFDREQSGLYRAVFTYGVGYTVVTAGEPYPVMRALGPRQLTALYGDDPDWPDFALERSLTRRDRFRLYDEAYVWTLGYDRDQKRFGVLGPPSRHGSPYCPVIRYRDAADLDLDDEPIAMTPPTPGRNGQCDIVAGQVAPLMTLQDQSDMTTFSLRAAEWYSAFRQRWIVGWTPGSTGDKMRSAASQMWTFDADPDEIKLGEFAETTLDGFIRSRSETARFVASLSQTPVHELIGELVNLSAEALAAAENGRTRKVNERETGLGESHEQMAQCVGDLMGVDVPDDFEVVWRDTTARAFGAIVDGLGKIAQQLGVPDEALWERIPGATRQELRRWKSLRAQGDAIGDLTALLDRQAAPPPALPAPGGEQRTQSGLILPPGARV